VQPGLGRKPLRVLLVDDHRDTREMYALSLEFAGMSVRCSSTASAVLAMIAVERPDIVITDLHLSGQSGLDLAHLITSDRAHRRLPVVLLTSDTRADLPARARAAGCSAVVIKPIMPDALAVLITTTIAGQRPPLPAWMLHLPDEPFVPPTHPILSLRGFRPAEETAE
jgi:two-component system chemotaxis response regulator CheY